MPNKKPAEKWLEIFNHFEVLEPDGWRAAGVSWDTPITYNTFRHLCAESTLRLKGGFPQVSIWNPTFESDTEALEYLEDEGFDITRGIITYPKDYKTNKATEAALNYMFGEWDYEVRMPDEVNN